jgi:hypothetical protein
MLLSKGNQYASTYNQHIISMKSEGSVETPTDIMEECNGCSVPQYTAYPLLGCLIKGGPSAQIHSESRLCVIRKNC